MNPDPVEPPKLLATIPPMDWIAAQWVPSTDGPEHLMITPAIGFQYFAPQALWVEPIAGVVVLSFDSGGARWNSKGPIPAELFRLGMVDISNMAIVTSMAFGMPAQIELKGPACTVLLGGKHLTQDEYLWRDARHRHYVPGSGWRR